MQPTQTPAKKELPTITPEISEKFIMSIGKIDFTELMNIFRKILIKSEVDVSEISEPDFVLSELLNQSAQADFENNKVVLNPFSRLFNGNEFDFNVLRTVVHEMTHLFATFTITKKGKSKGLVTTGFTMANIDARDLSKTVVFNRALNEAVTDYVALAVLAQYFVIKPEAKPMHWEHLDFIYLQEKNLLGLVISILSRRLNIEEGICVEAFISSYFRGGDDFKLFMKDLVGLLGSDSDLIRVLDYIKNYDNYGLKNNDIYGLRSKSYEEVRSDLESIFRVSDPEVLGDHYVQEFWNEGNGKERDNILGRDRLYSVFSRIVNK